MKFFFYKSIIYVFLNFIVYTWTRYLLKKVNLHGIMYRSVKLKTKKQPSWKFIYFSPLTEAASLFSRKYEERVWFPAWPRRQHQQEPCWAQLWGNTHSTACQRRRFTQRRLGSNLSYCRLLGSVLVSYTISTHCKNNECKWWMQCNNKNV